MTTDFYNVVLGARTGTVCIAFGYRPFRNDAGKYKHAEWREMRYSWPAAREELLADIEREVDLGDPVDVYLCPAVRHSGAKGRRKGDALPPLVCWADLDGFPADVALFAQLVEVGAYLVRSGSGDHLHVYLPLTRPVDLGTHARLGQALAARLGGDAKWSDETLLRPPATYNWKATVPPDGQPAGPKVLVEVQTWNGRQVDPIELAALLGVDLAAPTAAAGPGDSSSIVAAPAPAVLPPAVQRALDDPDVSDRSRACARVIGACAAAGLTPEQTLTVVAGYGPAARYKNAKHMTADVARFHAKALADRAARRTDPDDLVDRRPLASVTESARPGGTKKEESPPPTRGRRPHRPRWRRPRSTGA